MHPEPPPGLGGPTDVIGDYALKRIDYKVGLLASMYRLSDADRDDLRQDMMIELLKAAPRYRPERAKWATYVCRVLDIYFKQYCRQQSRRRTRGSFASFANHERRGRTIVGIGADDVRDEIDRLETRLTVETVLAGLPPKLRRFCQLLKEHSLAEVRRIMGIPHTSAYRMIDRLRRRFRDAGFENFCP